MIRVVLFFIFAATSTLLFVIGDSYADSVNSPNITLNVDTNRSVGAGAGNTAITVNTITVAETTLPEYSSGSGKAISISAKTGFRFVAGASITARSATIGINGGAINAVATQTAAGTDGETITFNLTSGTNTSTQDIIRINGVQVIIGSAAGAAGPAQTTMTVTTSTAGGAFTNQGIVAANITRGAADHLQFVLQPGSSQAGTDLLPSVRIVDFGNNVVLNDDRTISLAIEDDPGSATLAGTTSRATSNGVATWNVGDDLTIVTAANGYSLLASHSGGSFLTSDTVESSSFNMSAGNPGGLRFSTQPSDTSAGGDIQLEVQVVDEFDNLVTNVPVDVTINTISTNTTWPLLVDTSLTKTTSAGVASWGVSDHLRVNKAVSPYTLIVSGLGLPVESDAFDVVPGAASSLLFDVEPSTTTVNQSMDPAVLVEIVDAFGNSINSNATVTLSNLTLDCDSSLTGNTSVASGGIASFSSLAFDKPCEDAQLNATLASGSAQGVSATFDIKALNSQPVVVGSMRLKTGRVFGFTANGSFSVSKRAKDDPTKKGAVLTVTGTDGSVRYVLPKSGWTALGSRGFQFSNNKCQSVLVTPRRISASCKTRTGTLTLPEPDTLSVVLAVGRGTEEFCGECGGTPQGDQSSVFKRVNCSEPAVCP